MVVEIRRKDLEINDFDEIKYLLNKCQVLHLAINDNPSAYIVPVSYGFSIKENEICFYIHGARKGKKYELLKKESNVSVELEIFEDYKVVDSETKLNACNIGCYYKSFIGIGLVNELNNKKEKINALNLIVKHCGFNDYEIKNENIKNTAVFEIKISNYSVKGNI